VWLDAQVGGGILIEEQSALAMEASSLKANSALRSGGGIQVRRYHGHFAPCLLPPSAFSREMRSLVVVGAEGRRMLVASFL
jgi:hypothetical protein